MTIQQISTAPSSISVGDSYIWTVPGEKVGQYWPDIIKFLLMIEDPEWTTDEVYEQIVNKEAQVWGVVTDGEINGIWITKIIEGRDRYGLVWISAGRGNERVSLSEGIALFLTCTEQWFKEKGCRYVKIVGRRGWMKVLPGFKEHAVELRKYL